MHLDPPAAGDPRFDGFRISTLWAWTVIDDDDQEGLIGTMTRAGWMPLIASDRVRLDQYRELARQIAHDLGKPVRLRRFDGSTHDTLETIDP